MRGSSSYTGILLAAILLILSFASCIKDNGREWELPIGSRVPDFTVILNDGTSFSSASLDEGAGVIVFFHTGCPDCRQVLPILQQMFEDYSSEGIPFLLISRAEGGADVAAYWKEAGLTMPYSAREGREIYDMFASSRIPRIYLCKDGIIRRVFADSPVPTAEELSSAIELLLL